MSAYRAVRNIATSWICSALFLSGSLILSSTWAYGLNHWPAYLEIPLFVISAYFLFMSVGVALHAGPKGALAHTNAHSMLELLPLQAFVSDEAGRLKYANSAFQKYAGSLLSKVQHHDLFASVHPDDEHHVRKGFANGVVQRHSFSIEFRHRRSDGSFQRFEARFHCLEEAASRGQWLGVLVEIKDHASSGDETTKTDRKLCETLAPDNCIGDEGAFVEAAINQLTAILINSQACLRFLSADPANLSSVVVSMQRILRDAKEMSRFLKQISSVLSLGNQGRSVHLNALFTQIQISART